MKICHFVLFVLIYLQCKVVIHAKTIFSSNNYDDRRQEILLGEKEMMFGDELQLSEIENEVNDIIMLAKLDEYDNGFFNLSEFNPAFNFYTRKESIGKSDVFKFIKDMPKGAALHIHDTALIGGEYLLNITYEPDLYACYLDYELNFKFMKNKSQDDTCMWQLMKEMREEQGDIQYFDQRLLELFTMEMESPNVYNLDNYKLWRKLSRIFRLITPMLTYKPIWEKYYYDALKQYADDNIMYMEVRTTLPRLYDLEGNVYDEIECAKSFHAANNRFIQDHPNAYGMRIIYAPSRRVSGSVVKGYIETFKEIKRQLGDFVAGFDLVGQEDLGYPLIDFIEELKQFPSEYDLFYHAGETNWYGTSTDENLVDAVLLGAKRLGHAFALVKHPKVMEIVKKNNIAVEVNPISNQVLGYIADLRNHPAVSLFAENYPLVISSDDPGLWGALPLSHDLYEAFLGIASRNSDIRFLKKLCMNSILYSSMPEQQKQDALKEFMMRWNRYIEKYHTQFIV